MITETQTWSTLPSHYYFDENRYQQGILVPHEVEVYSFQQWVRGEMGER
jgi:hypothetical protein